jgi:hypothetical protein
MNSGKDLIRSTKSCGMSRIIDAVRGEGRIGRVGLFSLLKDRISDAVSFPFDEAFAIWWCASALYGEGELGERVRLILPN